MHRIYIVEDHQQIREAYALLIDLEPDLEICGMAASAEEALASLSETEPDLIIVDISLPGMSGLDLLRRLKANHPDLPSLVVSGHSEALYALGALEVGANGYLDKQEAADAMPLAIRHILDGHRFLSTSTREKLSDLSA